MNQRPLSSVPRLVLALLIGAMLLQATSALMREPPRTSAEDLTLPPSMNTLRMAAFGDPVPLAKLLMLNLQAFDLQAANQVRYQDLDYDRLIAWLRVILTLDPAGQYPLHAASRIYADVADETRQRKMLEFVYEAFFADPDHRWPWLAQAAAHAKHRLHDLPLARLYAAAIQQHTKSMNVPIWAKQMEAFILEDMNELEAAKVMIGGFIASGQASEPGELKFLEERLKQIESRLRTAKAKP
jgi:hypothetical protein